MSSLTGNQVLIKLSLLFLLLMCHCVYLTHTITIITITAWATQLFDILLTTAKVLLELHT